MGFFAKLKEMMTVEKVDYSEKLANGAVVLDVRSAMEFKTGHAPKSKNIPLQELSSKVSQFKGKEVIVVCLSGGRAGKAKRILESNGIRAHNAGPWRNVVR
jgi:phage shock protein E